MRPVRSRAFAWLALVAMLLLAAVPSLGRLAGGEPLPARASVHARHAMPAIAHGMHHAAEAQLGHRRDAPHPDGKTPGKNGHAGHDCAYCPLLSGLNLTASVPWLLRAPLQRVPWTVRAAASRPLDAPVPALGGQGPPVSAIA